MLTTCGNNNKRMLEKYHACRADRVYCIGRYMMTTVATATTIVCLPQKSDQQVSGGRRSVVVNRAKCLQLVQHGQIYALDAATFYICMWQTSRTHAPF